jgi:hypothetical protein
MPAVCVHGSEKERISQALQGITIASFFDAREAGGGGAPALDSNVRSEKACCWYLSTSEVTTQSMSWARVIAVS